MTTLEQPVVTGAISMMQRSSERLCQLRKSMFRSLFAVVAIIAIAGCATSTKVKQIDRLESVGENPRILIMEPDIKYYLLTVSGVPEPHAEWTIAARENFANALKAYANERGTEVVMMTDSNQLGSAEIEYSKLHGAVGLTIQVNHFGQLRLPNKEGVFDWSLGPGVAEIGEKYNADYALFSYYRDYQASGGRVAFAVLAAALGQVGGYSIGSEQGFASLVDLKSGDIVWFNVVQTSAGELRDEQGAGTVVTNLFKGMPQR
jgi:hypothetical protein